MEVNVDYHSDDSTRYKRQWQIDQCVGKQNYISEHQFFENCCLQPGVYTLVCQNKVGSLGWGNAYVEIQGNRYCDDFAGRPLMETIDIKGSYQDLRILKIIFFLK